MKELNRLKIELGDLCGEIGVAGQPWGFGGLGGGRGGKGSRVNDGGPTARQAIGIIERETKLRGDIAELQVYKMRQYDELLRLEMEPKYRSFATKRYFELKSWYDISAETGYAIRTLQKWDKRLKKQQERGE